MVKRILVVPGLQCQFLQGSRRAGYQLNTNIYIHYLVIYGGV